MFDIRLLLNENLGNNQYFVYVLENKDKGYSIQIHKTRSEKSRYFSYTNNQNLTL